jgi:hypothetical protein
LLDELHRKLPTTKFLTLVDEELVGSSPCFVSASLNDILGDSGKHPKLGDALLSELTPWQGIIRSKSQLATVFAWRFIALQMTFKSSQELTRGTDSTHSTSVVTPWMTFW